MDYSGLDALNSDYYSAGLSSILLLINQFKLH